MCQSLLARLLIVTLMAHSLVFALPRPVQAGMIGTQALLQSQDRQAVLEQVQQALSRSELRDRLVDWGVDPALARARVESLSDAELRQLATRLEELPAGGDVLGLIGAVFVVLIILELLGVTNVFSKL